MPTNSPHIHDKFRQLQQQYVAKLPEKIAALATDWQSFNQNPADTTQYQTLIRDFHSLAGSAGSFGFPAVSILCREIEDALKGTQPPLPATLKLEITNKLAALKRAANAGPTRGDQ